MKITISKNNIIYKYIATNCKYLLSGDELTLVPFYLNIKSIFLNILFLLFFTLVVLLSLYSLGFLIYSGSSNMNSEIFTLIKYDYIKVNHSSITIGLKILGSIVLFITVVVFIMNVPYILTFIYSNTLGVLDKRLTNLFRKIKIEFIDKQ